MSKTTTETRDRAELLPRVGLGRPTQAEIAQRYGVGPRGGVVARFRVLGPILCSMESFADVSAKGTGITGQASARFKAAGGLGWLPSLALCSLCLVLLSAGCERPEGSPGVADPSSTAGARESPVEEADLAPSDQEREPQERVLPSHQFVTWDLSRFVPLAREDRPGSPHSLVASAHPGGTVVAFGFEHEVITASVLGEGEVETGRIELVEPGGSVWPCGVWMSGEGEVHGVAAIRPPAGELELVRWRGAAVLEEELPHPRFAEAGERFCAWEPPRGARGEHILAVTDEGPVRYVHQGTQWRLERLGGERAELSFFDGPEGLEVRVVGPPKDGSRTERENRSYSTRRGEWDSTRYIGEGVYFGGRVWEGVAEPSAGLSLAPMRLEARSPTEAGGEGERFGLLPPLSWHPTGAIGSGAEQQLVLAPRAPMTPGLRVAAALRPSDLDAPTMSLAGVLEARVTSRAGGELVGVSGCGPGSFRVDIVRPGGHLDLRTMSPAACREEPE